jgi:hypothetical protein
MCRLYAHFVNYLKCKQEQCASSLQIHTLCTLHMQTLCTPSSTSQESVQRVCIFTLWPHNVYTIYILSAYPGVYFNLDLDRRNFRATEMSYTSVSTRLHDNIPRKQTWLRVYAHYTHTLIRCMHILFRRMHTLFRHWKTHLFSRVLQTPSESLLV